MIKPSLIELIHKGTVIQRWNDHIRPFTGFTEIDKQAHKTFYAFILAKCQQDSGGEVNFNRLIEGLVFEYLHRIILTDIKPPIYHRLKEQMGDQISAWVEQQLEDEIGEIKGDFNQKLHWYLLDNTYSVTEKKIIKFAHYLATKWEFDIIYPMNIGMYNIEKTRSEVNSTLSTCDWFEGKKMIYQSPKIFDFLNLIGQLRFQQRWTATARIPQTSVMGHTLVVAMLSYFFTLEMDGCPQRCTNNFFGGLFHDLPEVLTRDIISPVKRGVEGLDNILKEIEDSQMKDIVYPLLPDSWSDQLEYYTQNEFYSKIRQNGEVKIVSSEKISRNYNRDEFDPIDGKIIRGCDHLSAYLEAYLSMQNGIEAEPLKKAIEKLYSDYQNSKIADVDLGSYFQYFYQKYHESRQN